MVNFITYIQQKLSATYDFRESASIARLILEKQYHMTLLDFYRDKDTSFCDDDLKKADKIIERLLRHEPIQYILGEADFGDLTFNVDPSVLIPRPETEDLVAWIQENSEPSDPCRILDMGTGSGCIAITLAHHFPHAQVFADDISDQALQVARANAEKNRVNVTFRHKDILTSSQTCTEDDDWDIIVSNPPYVLEKEKTAIDPNVLLYEPHQALFVSDQSPLLYYQAIADYAGNTLRLSGAIYVEINASLEEETARLFKASGFPHIEVRQDRYGRNRMLKIRP